MRRNHHKLTQLLLLCCLSLFVFASACSMTKPDETESVPATEPRAATTSAATITPTAPPTSTPIPASIFIPRETLPDGLIFETGYYAVLPGEGVYYNVFDCYGNQIDSFLFPEGGGAPPIGLFTEQDLSLYTRLNQKDVKTVITQRCDGNKSILYSSQNGFYQMDSQNQNVILYDKDGQCIRTIKPPKITSQDYVETALGCLGNETVVAFRTMDEDANSFIDLYFVASDGMISNTCKAINPVGFIGRAYYLTQSDTGDQGICDLVDYTGNVVMKDVDSLPESTFCVRTFIPAMWLKISDDFHMTIPISDTFTKDGILYDSSLHAIQKNQLGADGKLIYGAKYDVAGITCSTTYGRSGQDYFNWRDDIVAVGMQNNQIALKTNDAEYVFACNGSSYCGMNDYVLLLKKDTGEIEVILLRTGEILYTISYNDLAGIADEYVLVRTDYQPNTGVSHGEYLIDKVGNVRYVTQNSYFSSTYGENIVLYRGPYVGIADLNGDWVIKTPTTKMTRDAATPEYWANIT